MSEPVSPQPGVGPMPRPDGNGLPPGVGGEGIGGGGPPGSDTPSPGFGGDGDIGPDIPALPGEG